jgi:hypothetical protein
VRLGAPHTFAWSPNPHPETPADPNYDHSSTDFRTLLGTGSSSSGNTMALIELAVIQRAIAAAGFPRVIDTMAAAFQAYSADKTVVCPVQHLGPFRPSVSG